MKRAIFQGAAILVAMSASAFAQTATGPAPAPTMVANTPAANASLAATPGATASSVPSPSGASQKPTGLRLQLRANLEQAGFTAVTIMPESFLVQAIDKSGNHVTMFLTPDSLTVVGDDNAAPQTTPGRGTALAAATPQAGAATTQPGATTQSGTGGGVNDETGVFATIPAKDDLSSNLIGVSIYNAANQNIGTIKDIAFAGRRVQAYIVGVGGFLGIGDHYVAIRPSAITVTYDVIEKRWHAALDTDAAALKAAPEYKYAS